MAQVGDTVQIGQTVYEVVFDGRQELLRDRPVGREPDRSPIGRACEPPMTFRRDTRRYVRSAPLAALSTT